jgi:hypothetical protein
MGLTVPGKSWSFSTTTAPTGFALSIVSHAKGANGGKATATSGKGGGGDAISLDGANGGSATATGGDGENSYITYLGKPIGPAGDGGKAFLLGGGGGGGTADCVAGSTSVRGGNGGAGGTGSGKGGNGGTQGASFGADAAIDASSFGNGGNGGRGVPPGGAGAAGADSRTGQITTKNSFAAGIPGAACPGTAASYNGTWNGTANLVPNSTALSGAPANVLALPTCAGSSVDYTEQIAVNFGSNGSGTVQMNDTPQFQRTYNGMLAANGTFVSSGSFPFFDALIPTYLKVTFVNGSTITFVETSLWGTCANTYSGTLNK